MDENSFRIKETPITRTEVFKRLYQAITSGYFKPNDRLIEKDLSELLGVSRTPIREALRELERMKLVKSEPYKGVVVTKITLKEVDEIFTIRIAMDSLAVQLCINSISNVALKSLEKNIKVYEKSLYKQDLTKLSELDDSFHSTILESTDNNTLKEIEHNLESVIIHFRLITLPLHKEETLKEHKEIYSAILAHDQNRAVKAVCTHINALWIMVKEQLKNEDDIVS